jgi:hypothetical protein
LRWKMMRWQCIIHLVLYLHFLTNHKPVTYPPSIQASLTSLHLKVRKNVCLFKFCHDKVHKCSFYICFSIDMSVTFGVIFYYYYGSTALCWTLAAFSVSWSYTQLVGLLGLGISLSQGLYLHT